MSQMAQIVVVEHFVLELFFSVYLCHLRHLW
jgi:hypothetical protein